MAELEQIITNVLTLMTGLGVAVCAVFLAIAGYHYMTSAGNPDATERSKAAAFNAVLGLGPVLTARILANVVRSAITGAPRDQRWTRRGDRAGRVGRVCFLPMLPIPLGEQRLERVHPHPQHHHTCPSNARSL